MKKRYKTAIPLLFLTVLILAAGCLSAQQANKGLVGNPAPDFTLTLLNGNTLSLHDLKGKVVILNFWATWCPPCRGEIPDFVRFYADYAKQDCEIIGVSVDSGDSGLQEFVKKNRMNYPVGRDSSQQLSIMYGGIRAIPTTFVIDRKGIIRKMQVGAVDLTTLENMAKPYL